MPPTPFDRAAIYPPAGLADIPPPIRTIVWFWGVYGNKLCPRRISRKGTIETAPAAEAGRTVRNKNIRMTESEDLKELGVVAADNRWQAPLAQQDPSAIVRSIEPATPSCQSRRRDRLSGRC